MAKKFDQQAGKQTKVRAGGKNGITIVVDTAVVPSRGASLSTRARWAHGYLNRFLAGDAATKRNLKLASQWLGQAINSYEELLRK